MVEKVEFQEKAYEEAEFEDDPYTITEEMLENRLKKGYKGRCITQFFAGLTAIIGATIFGHTLGLCSPVLKKNFITHGYTQFERPALISSILPLGMSLGSVFWAYLNKKIGPRKTMLYQAIFSAISWSGMVLNFNTKCLMASLFFCGFFSICYIVCGEKLLLESVHYGYIKVYLILFKSFIYFGVLAYTQMSVVLESLPKGCTFYPIGFNLIHFLLLIFVCPESPVFLYMKSDPKALKTLIWYRGEYNLSTDLRNLKRDAEYKRIDPESYKYMLYSKCVLKALGIIALLTVVQVFSGYYCFIFFILVIWSQYGGQYVSEYIQVTLFGCTLFISSLISNYVHFNLPFGVRKPLLISIILLIINLSTAIIYCTLWYFDIKFFKMSHWLPIVISNTNVIFYDIGLGILPDKMLLEYLPYQIFSLAKTISKAVHWFCVFLMIEFFSGVCSEHWGYKYGFVVCLGFVLVGYICVYKYVIETKNKTLVQIQIELGGNPVGRRGAYRRHVGKKHLEMF